MNTKKIFGVKSITNLLYGIAMLLPMFSILGRVIYIQANPNAKDSYSGSTTTYVQQPKYQTNEVNSFDDLIDGHIYDLYLYDSVNEVTLYTEIFDYFSFIYVYTNFDVLQYDFTVDETDYYDYNAYFYLNSDGNCSLTVYKDLYLNDVRLYDILICDELYCTEDSYYFTIIYDVYFNFSSIPLSFIKSSSYQEYDYIAVEQSTLDNAFDYSIKSFIDGNNLGKVDMFGWFTNLFLDSNNAVNNLYVGFVNWYLNYALLISSGYLIFLVLIWFINFVRKIMDKSMYQDYGGF